MLMRFIRRLAIVSLTGVLPLLATAHPLGNASIDQHSTIQVGASEIRIDQVVDMAEIPTLQETKRIDTDKNRTLSESELTAYAAALAVQYVQKLRLTLNGHALPLRAEVRAVQFAPGAANLHTLRIEWTFFAAIPPSTDIHKVTFHNYNYTERGYLNEIQVKHAQNVELFDRWNSAQDTASSIKPVPLLTTKNRTIQFYYRALGN